MARSTLTLEDYRTEAEDLLGLDSGSNDLLDKTILIAADKYTKFYRSIEVLGFTEHGRTDTGLITIPVAGYDLTAIGDLYDSVQGFKAYKGSIDPLNRLLPVRRGSGKYGYYINGSMFYINEAIDDTSIVIQYQQKQTRISTSSVLADITPDIDEAFEDMLVLYIAHRYYARNGDDPQSAEDALNDSRNLTLENFNLKRRNANTAI